MRPFEARRQPGRVELRAVGLLGETAHARPQVVGGERLLRFSRVAPALGQVERVAGVVRLVEQTLFEDLRVAPVLLLLAPLPAARPAADDEDAGAFEDLAAVPGFAVQVLVEHAHVGPGQAGGDQGGTPVDDGAVVHREAVRVQGELRHAEAGLYLHQVIGVEEQQVVRVSAGELDRLGAAGAESPPRPLVQHAGQIAEEFPDDLLGAVRRARVHDHPGVDQRAYRFETAPDHRSLIFDDHVQADFCFQGSHPLW